MLRTLSTSLTLLLLAGCSDNDGQGNGNEGPVAPTIVLEAPSAGAFVSASTIQVTGQVKKGSAPLASLEYNGKSLELDGNGGFSTTVSVSDGINLVDLVATAHDGERAVEGISFHGGEVNAPGATLESAAMLFLGEEALDDDEPDTDDLAGIAELVIAGDALSESFVGNTMQSDYFTFTPNTIEYTAVDVEISASGDSVWVGVTLYDLWVDYTIVGDTWYWWAEHEGSAWADSVTVWSELQAGSSSRGIWVEADNTDVDMNGYGLTVEYIPDALEGYLGDWTEETIEEQIGETIEEKATELLDKYLSVFELQFEPLDGVSLDLSLADIEVSSGGLNMTLDVSTSSSAADLPAGAGSLSTDGDAPSWPPYDVSTVALAVDDDVINQAIFAAWAIRLRDGITMEGDDVSGMPVPAPLGPFARVEATVALPPVLTAPVDGESLSGIGIGELDLIMEREDGEINRVNVGVTAGVSLELEDGALSLDFDLGADTTEMAIGIREVAADETEADIADIASLMLPIALGLSGSYIPGFTLPTYDLGRMGFEDLEGVELGFGDLTWERTSDGWFTAEGALN